MSASILSSARITGNTNLESMWKEVVKVYFRLVFGNLPVETEEYD
jgi:hypothetical protein